MNTGVSRTIETPRLILRPWGLETDREPFFILLLDFVVCIRNQIYLIFRHVLKLVGGWIKIIGGRVMLLKQRRQH